MKSNSNYEFQPVEHSGKEIRFHWNIFSFIPQTDLIGEVRDSVLHWETDEALCLEIDTREVMLEKLLTEGCHVETANELLDSWFNKTYL